MNLESRVLMLRVSANRANLKKGEFEPRWPIGSCAVKYHTSPRMMELNKASQAVVQYADLSDIVKMLNMEAAARSLRT